MGKIIYRKILPILIISAIFISLFQAQAYGEGRYIVNAVIPEDVYHDLKLFLNGIKPVKIQDFSGRYSRRDVVEPMLLIKALAHAAPELRVQFVPLESSHDRMLDLVKRGIYDLTSTTVWDVDLEEKYLSTPLINKGEFVAGIYVLPDNEKALKARSLEEIRQLTFVSSKKWAIDWATLADLSVKAVYHVSQWKYMPKMVSSKRVDALLAPFQSNAKLQLQTEEGDLIPVPGVKIGLKGARHFGVADKSVEGVNLKEAVNRGLVHLRKSGTIQRAYEESGFFNIHVKDWLLINDAKQ